jgi:hypothetical protein
VLSKLFSVFVFGMVGLWEGIPLGFVLKLPPTVIAVVSALGSLTATLLVASLGDRFGGRFLRERAASFASFTNEKHESLLDRVWRRYGIIGLALLAPCVTGAPVAVALGFFLKLPKAKLLAWLVVGIGLWSLILTAAGAYGSHGVRKLFMG